MFDLALQEFDFVGRELEEGVDAVVQFGFGVRLPMGQTRDGIAVLGQIRLPLVSQLP